ncbi:MAG: hypothetical protein IJ911_11955 [Salinivirgaceae bacterium]|nr:hypothetical protein [Salinivirgaceae bacterium]
MCRKATDDGPCKVFYPKKCPLGLILQPYTPKELYIEGVISEYIEEIVRCGGMGKGGARPYSIESYYIIIDGIRLDFDLHDERKIFMGKETYWESKFEGKYAKVCYLQKSKLVIHDIELEDGSYSYHDPHEISYYDVGWFPFCITAPIALFCIFVILRFFYLLIFASDERRELVFGDKDYNPF